MPGGARRTDTERRAGGDVVHVEVAPGVVTVIAAWMLDAAACACMEIGPLASPPMRWLTCTAC